MTSLDHPAVILNTAATLCWVFISNVLAEDNKVNIVVQCKFSEDC